MESAEEARAKGMEVVKALVEPIVSITMPMDMACREAFWLGFLHSIRGCVTADVSPPRAVKIYADLAAGAVRAAKKKKLN